MLVQKKLDLIQRVQYCSFASAPSKYKKVPRVTDSLYFETNRADCVILFIVEVQQMEKGFSAICSCIATSYPFSSFFCIKQKCNYHYYNNS